MAYEQLKQRQSVMWGTGPYQRITETLADIHEQVIGRAAPRPGTRWLDLACGTGAIAERAAASGALVTGIDLAPALIDTAKQRAARAKPKGGGRPRLYPRCARCERRPRACESCRAKRRRRAP